MSQRKQFKALMEANKEKIKALQDANTDLEIQLLQICDSQQWYKEEYEDLIISKRPKKTEKIIIGRIYWNEDFRDVAAGPVVTIERSRVVRKDGIWLL